MNSRYRFAPSPTGNLHLGTLRAALFNWLLAQKKSEDIFVCRIEDTDRQRSETGFESSIFEGMAWLGLHCDESPLQGGDSGPYRQSERTAFYAEHIQKLLDQGLAYYCFSTASELDDEREAAKKAKKPYVYSGKYRNYPLDKAKARLAAGEKAVLRFKMPQQGRVTVSDLIRGEVTFDYALIGDFVIQKSDGSPAFNFAVVVDDALMKITHVIRGEDHLSNMPRQLALFDAFGYQAPQFAHLPMILGPDKSKLSKRHGATNVMDYQKQGFLPEAMLNYLALLGWTPSDGQEKMALADLIKAFSIEGINKSGAVFDLKKLTWLNGLYIRDLPAPDFKQRVLPFLDQESQNLLTQRYHEAQLDAIMALAQSSLHLLADIKEFICVFIEDDEAVQRRRQELGFVAEQHSFLRLLKAKLTELPDEVLADDMDSVLSLIVDETGLGKGKVFRPTRIAITGFQSGPDLMQILALLGPKKLTKRLEMLLS